MAEISRHVRGSAMALKIKLAYQWRLFLPLIGLLWVMIGCMMWWQYHREEDMRQDEVRQMMDFINARILFEREVDNDVYDLFAFLGQYYREDPIYSKMRISVYDAVNGVCIYSRGELLPFDEADRNAPNTEIVGDDGHRLELAGHRQKSLYYSITHSQDRNVVVYSAVPYDSMVADALMGGATEIWVAIGILALAITLVAFLTTTYVSNTLKRLRNFATRAAHDESFIPDDKFGHDELGEIGRQIVHIFNARSEAVKNMKREHELTLKTIEEKNLMKRRMTNNVSHELKTPVCIVKGYLDTIVDNPDMDERSRDHFIRKAQENINRMDSLIKDISTLNRFDDGADVIPTEPIDYHDVVLTVEGENEESGLLRDMKFENHVPEGTFVDGNFSLLVAMLHNLTKNAVMYSQGTKLGVRIDSEDDEFYHFTFYDNGVGVGEEHLPHLFKRFYCVDSGRSRKSCGTGLGLPIVYDTVVFHGGEISITNASEGGLEFHYTLRKSAEPAE